MVFALKSTFCIKKLKILRSKVTEIFMNLRIKSFVNIHPEAKHYQSSKIKNHQPIRTTPEYAYVILKFCVEKLASFLHISQNGTSMV
jgi:hypothetical protein